MISPRRVSRVVLVSFALLITLAPLAPGDEVVTVLLKTGEKHEQVTYRILSRFNVLEMRSGERFVNVSFSDIEAIYDAEGNNIAPRLLGTRFRPKAAEPPPGAEAQPDTSAIAGGGGNTPGGGGVGITPSPGEPWHVVFALDGGLDLPFGDYYDGTKGGLGFGGTMHIAVTREVALRGSVTLLGVGFEESFGLISYDPQLQIVSQDFDIDALRLLVGAEYHKSVGGCGAPWGFWYVHSSLGAIRHGLQGEAVLLDLSTSQTYRAVFDDDDTRFTMGNGIGVIYGLSDRLGVLASGDLDMVWTKVYLQGGGTSVGIKGVVFGLHAGLALRL